MKKNKEQKPTFALWEVLIITLVASLIMSLSTGYVVYRSISDSNCNKINESKYLEEFITSYNKIISNYYTDIDESKLIDAAINGMLSYLGDPYTTYLDESNTDMLNDSLNGTYEGIGIQVTQNDLNQIVVNEVYDNTPAKISGIEVNDIITRINNIDLNDKKPSDAVEIIKNSDEIILDVNRSGELLSFNIKKDTLYVPAINKDLIIQNNKKTGYLRISKFSDSISEQFSTSLKELEKDNIDSLIIDLRDNTGGYLSGATKIAELFLKKDKIIYSLENKSGKEDTKDSTEESRNYPIYVLINEQTASASEVLASALKYSYNATLIGQKSYGKGKVQKTSKLSDGTMYKYTSAKWLTPIGTCIDEVGLTPDIKVELNEDNIEEDIILKQAINEILK